MSWLPVRPARLGLSVLTALALFANGRPQATPQGTRTAPPAPGSIPLQSDEFVGPFPSWANAKLVYGAMGDGVADDSAALQRALSELGQPGHPPVLYLPAGTYRLTRTLLLTTGINLSIVGEDPARTTLIWDGAPGGTMARFDGLAYSRITRLTFDGRKKASIAIDQSWTGGHSYFDTGNEYSDDTFMDVDYGIHGGFKDGGFAETAIRRAQFLRNATAGVALGNFNALDIWIWDSLFEDCRVGVTNTPGAGNFHVYNSVFRRSSVADLMMGNTGGFSVRGNYSVRSKTFFVSDAPTSNPATIAVQGNTIVDAIDTAVIRLGNQGPGLFLDNIVRSRPGARGPVVQWSSFPEADLATIGNTFTVDGAVQSTGRLVSFDDRVGFARDLNLDEPARPGPLPSLGRRVFEVAAGSGGAAIQRAIDAAAAITGARPVVHVPDGTYDVEETLRIPPSDVQLVGDGYGTTLRWTGRTGPVIRLEGPSKAALRELRIDGMSAADGLLVQGADQPGARVHVGQTELRAGRTSTLFVNGLDYALVQAQDLGVSESPTGSVIKVVGGPLARAGRPEAVGRTTILSGASSGNRTTLDVSDGGKLLVRDLWYEAGAGPGFAKIQGNAEFTLDGARIASPRDQTPPAFDIDGLNGRVAILNTDLDDRVVLSGSGASAQLLVLGMMSERTGTDAVVNRASPAARSLVINARHLAGFPLSLRTRSVALGDSATMDQGFVRTLLGPARVPQPALLTALPAGVTDVRLFRVWVTRGINDVTISR